MDLMDKLKMTSAFIRQKTSLIPTIGIILGSGLDGITPLMTDVVEFPSATLPHFLTSTVQGHQGMILIGKLDQQVILVMKGRIHYYEGHSLSDSTYPIRLMHILGVKTLILSNACGAVNETYKAGTMMLIKDHLNLTGNNPLIGKNHDELGPRFPDASDIYTEELRIKVKTYAKDLAIPLEEGVYAWWSGPSYETPAEIKMIRLLGADAVGMSTVPEALVASHMGMKVIGLSCLTNMAAGILPQKLSHEEVLIAAKKISLNFGILLREIIANCDK